MRDMSSSPNEMLKDVLIRLSNVIINLLSFSRQCAYIDGRMTKAECSVQKLTGS